MCYVDAPEPRTREFALTGEDEVASYVVDTQHVFVQLCRAFGITQFSETEKVVSESWYDVASPCRFGRDCGYG